eukprot:jgi/Mesvir1/1196/Mv17688-RA.1
MRAVLRAWQHARGSGISLVDCLGDARVSRAVLAQLMHDSFPTATLSNGGLPSEAARQLGTCASFPNAADRTATTAGLRAALLLPPARTFSTAETSHSTTSGEGAEKTEARASSAAGTAAAVDGPSKSNTPARPANPNFTPKELTAMETTSGLNNLLERLYDTGHLFNVKVAYAIAKAKPTFSPNSRTYSLVILSQAMLKVDPNRLYRYLEDAREYHVTPQLAAYNKILQGCAARDDRHLLAERVLHEMDAAGVQPDRVSLSKAVQALCNGRQLDKAIALNDRLRAWLQAEGSPLNESVLYYCYPRLLECCVAVKAYDAALKVLEAAGQDGVQVPVRAIVDVLVAVASGNHMDLTQLLLRMVIDARQAVPEASLLPVLQAAARNADVAMAGDVWRHLTWSLTHGAPALDNKRRFLNLEKSVPAPSSAIPSKAILGAPPVKPRAESYAAMVWAYAAADDAASAFRALSDLFAAHPGQVASFGATQAADAVVRACSRNVEVLDQAYFALVDMHNKGVDRVSLTHLHLVLRGCANLGDASRAAETFSEISNTFGLSPSLESYHILIELNSALQRPAEVAAVYEHMTTQGHVAPTKATYELLVKACVTAGDLEVAVAAAEALMNAGIRCSPALLDLLQQHAMKTSRELVLRVKMFMHKQGLLNGRALHMDLMHRLVNHRQDAASLPPSKDATVSA